jgi:hypothetical protein
MPDNRKKVKAMNKHGKRKQRGPLALRLNWSPPPSHRVNFVATQTFSLSEPAAGAGGYKFFQLNNIYDVDATVGGPSAAGYAQYAALYGKYRVDRVRFRYNGYVVAGGVACGQVCVMPTGTNTVVPTPPSAWPIQRRAKCVHTVPTSSGSGALPVVIDVTYSMADLFGVSLAKYIAEDNYASATGTGPTNTQYCALTVYGISSTAIYTISGSVSVSFDVLFFNPLIVSP